MKLFVQAIVVTIWAIDPILTQKNGDEGRPYEFGFTIDGQQHRHEKKDERGIIQGEFGFITADGIYHVTVYATDENGNFKILRMRNLRISAPLDGSPLRGEISPEANKYRKQANLPLLPEPNSLSVPEGSKAAPTPKPQFTTVSTIKPACASCGYVTTTPKPRPEAIQQQQQPFGVQGQYENTAGIPGTGHAGLGGLDVGTGAAGNVQIGQDQQTVFNNGLSPGAANPPSQYDLHTAIPQKTPSEYQLAAGPQSTNYQQNGGVSSSTNYENAGTPDAGYQQGGGVGQPSAGQNYEGSGGSADLAYPGASDSGSGTPNTNYKPGGDAVVQSSLGQNYEGSGGSAGPTYPGTGAGNSGLDTRFGGGEKEALEANPLKLPGRGPAGGISTLPPVSVSDNVIHVGGERGQDIPIKDKYPGMQDGLPEGVEEKDITDLLYKFHYTVGFHGHYEKGLKNGAKIGGYFVNGRDGISRVVTYVADENGYRPKVKFIRLGLDSEDTPKAETEKTFGLKSFEFVWYPI